ncbi:MAG: hypothetical protein LBR90_04290 [Elusimicrobiota bacterium]|jgi:hypothetical protein|nr:hypothetical protein [Elusimicrobiota bacterium]
MPTTLIISCAVFFVCLALLFYFIAKYREAEVKDNGEELDLPGQGPADAGPGAAQEAVRLFTKTIGGAKETADIKDKLKDLHYRLEEMKLTEEKRAGELAKAVEKLEQRVSTFETEYVNKLQPALYSLINELENIQNKTK